MGRYSGVTEARESEKLPRLPKGNYVVEVTSVKDGYAPATDVEYFAADLKVLEVIDSEESVPVGGLYSFFVKLNAGTMRPTNLGRAKSFVRLAMSNLLGHEVSDDEIQESHMEDAAGPDQPLTGARLNCLSYEITTKAGKPFGLYKFTFCTTQ